MMNLDLRQRLPDESNIRHRESKRKVASESSIPRKAQRSENPALLLIAKERRKFLNFVLASVRDRDVAEEVLQRASVKVVSRAGSLRDPARAEPWIYRLLRNEITDYFRRRAVHSKRTAELTEDLALDLSSTGHSSEPRICPCAAEELAGLHPNYSEALRAVEMGGEPIVDYAARKGVSANSATVLAHRARRSLRTRLQSRCGTCAGSGCFDCSCSAQPTPRL